MQNSIQGQVGFDEFDSWWLGKGGGVAAEREAAEELADLFTEVDKDNSGQIDVDEFINASTLWQSTPTT